MKLSVDAINEKSPFWVIQLDDMLFRFITKNGIKYRVGFYPDTFFMTEDAYHFFLERVDEGPAIYDSDVLKVVTIIIEEFFRVGTNVMLYICDPSDSRQEQRSRLYKIWFESYSNRDAFTLADMTIDFEGQIVYGGLLIRKNHPAYIEILEAFNDFVHLVPYDTSIVDK